MARPEDLPQLEPLNRLAAFAEAEAPLREVVRLDPAFSRGHFELGYSLHQQGKVSEAAANYREAIRLQPDFAVAYYDLSYCLLDQHDRAGAIDALRAAVRYEPGFTQAYRQLAELLTLEGRPREAREAFHRAAQLAREGDPSQATDDPAAARPHLENAP